MNEFVAALLNTGKGILAANESFPTIGKRFAALGIGATEENRRAYREMLFTTKGLGDFISSVILFEETLRQRTLTGVAMPEILKQQGIVPGIKVDIGAKTLAAFAREKITMGLDWLRERLAEYRKLGARFIQWAAVFAVDEHLPTRACVEANGRALALLAALNQETALVPTVEPWVLMNGKHTIVRCEAVTTLTLKTVFDALFEQQVILEHMLLKAGMILSGAECPKQTDAEEVSEATPRCLRRTAPAHVPGVVFLSGGQSDEAATQNPNDICRGSEIPWKVTFTFARALQAPAMNTWKGSADNVVAAQKMLHHHAQCNSAAIQGKSSRGMEKARLTSLEIEHV
jgi:fructose-bisphosphate aldolase class I